MTRAHTAIGFLLLILLLSTELLGSGSVAATAIHPDRVQATGVPAATPVQERHDSQTATGPANDTATTLFLPAVSDGFTPCGPTSPFSLEIAAIHQVQEDGGVVNGPAAQAEWDSRVEAGFPTLLEALTKSGACWTRVEISWRQIQPEEPPSEYEWDWFDEKLRLVAGTGVQIIAIIAKVPDWAGDREKGPIYTGKLDEFADFLTAAVNRYGQEPYGISHWELINEPDASIGYGNHGVSYKQMLEVAYPAIKAADSEATVLMGGLAYDWFEQQGGPFSRYFVDDVMSAGGGEFIDATNIHYFPIFADEWERWGIDKVPTCGKVGDGKGKPYAAPGIDLASKLNHFRNRMDTCYEVDKPVWVTELGEHGYPANVWSLEQQSRYVIQGYARGLAAGAENITWFALVSPPYDQWQQGLLFKEDWSPKPAYYTYQTLTSELRGYSYANTLKVDSVEGYEFQSPGRPKKTVAWSTRPEGRPPLNFKQASALRVVDRLGNVTTVQDGGPGDLDGSRNQQVKLQLSEDPVFISRKK